MFAGSSPLTRNPSPRASALPPAHLSALSSPPRPPDTSVSRAVTAVAAELASASPLSPLRHPPLRTTMTVRRERVSTRHGVLRAARPWAEGHGSAAVAGAQCSVSPGGSAVQLRRRRAGSRNTWIPVESPTLPPHVSARSAPHAGPPRLHPGGRTAAVRGRAPLNCHPQAKSRVGSRQVVRAPAPEPVLHR